jgi:hypothetical protein
LTLTFVIKKLGRRHEVSRARAWWRFSVPGGNVKLVFFQVLLQLTKPPSGTPRVGILPDISYAFIRISWICVE